MNAVLILLGAVCLITVARSAAHQKHAVRAVLGSALCGLSALALLNLLAPYTGVSLPLNYGTGFVGAVLGAPGVILLLLLNLVLV